MLAWRLYKLIGIIPLVMTGCTPPPSAIAPANIKQSYQTSQQKLVTLTHWRIRGGLAVKEGNQGLTASLIWQQSGKEHFLINLLGPLGTGSLKLTVNDKQVEITDGKQRFLGNDPELLIKQHTGHTIPVKSLFYWVRGLPYPNTPSTKVTDQFGHLRSLEQQGWKIIYQRFTSFKGLDLPSKLTALKQNTKIKVIINQWGS